LALKPSYLVYMAVEILPKLDRFAGVLPILRWLPPGSEGRMRANRRRLGKQSISEQAPLG